MKSSKADLADALSIERQALSGLVKNTPREQLKGQSLCSEWKHENVLSHILSFELNKLDAVLLICRLQSLDTITARQAKRYTDCTTEEYLVLLEKGLKHTLRLVRFTPSFLLNRKLIPVPNGRLSLAQLYGDLAMDRAIHYLDIAAPMGIANTITEPAAMKIALQFVLASIDLLNFKIPRKFYGKFMKLELTGLCSDIYYWKIGTDVVCHDKPVGDIVLSAACDTNDFLFTISVRPALIQKPVLITGERELETIIRKSFNANALWER